MCTWRVRCFGLRGPRQCSADTGADTWKKQALYHMPGWLTLAEQVQTPIKFSSLSARTKKEELTAGSDEKTQRSPAGNQTQGLANSRSHALTTEQRSHNGNCVWIVDFHQAVSSFSTTRWPGFARVYKHAATIENSLDFNPFNRKLALVGIIPNQILFSFSSDKDRSADTLPRQSAHADWKYPVFLLHVHHCV